MPARDRVTVEVLAEVQSGVNDLKRFVASVTAAVASVRGIAEAFKFVVQSAAQVEQARVQFQVLLGDVDRAKELYADLQEFAAKTPLQLEGITEAAKRLLAYGTAQEEIIEKLQMLGDAAMGDQAAMDRLVESFGRVQVKGKATLEDLNRFAEAGVPIYNELAAVIGVTRNKLFEMVQKGQVGYRELETALRRLTTGQGQFAGQMEAQSQTLNGMLSTLKDNITLLAAEIGETLLPTIKAIVQTMGGWIEGLRTWRGDLQGFFASARGEMGKTEAAIQGQIRTAEDWIKIFEDLGKFPFLKNWASEKIAGKRAEIEHLTAAIAKMNTEIARPARVTAEAGPLSLAEQFRFAWPLVEEVAKRYSQTLEGQAETLGVFLDKLYQVRDTSAEIADFTSVEFEFLRQTLTLLPQIEAEYSAILTQITLRDMKEEEGVRKAMKYNDELDKAQIAWREISRQIEEQNKKLADGLTAVARGVSAATDLIKGDFSGAMRGVMGIITEMSAAFGPAGMLFSAAADFTRALAENLNEAFGLAMEDPRVEMEERANAMLTAFAESLRKGDPRILAEAIVQQYVDAAVQAAIMQAKIEPLMERLSMAIMAYTRTGAQRYLDIAKATYAQIQGEWTNAYSTYAHIMGNLTGGVPATGSLTTDAGTAYYYGPSAAARSPSSRNYNFVFEGPVFGSETEFKRAVVGAVAEADRVY